MSNKETDNTKKLAELLDSKFRIPNTNIRFGIDPILGLIPGAGDWLAGVISLYFLIQAVMMGGRASVLGRMFINILLDVLIGSIPILGEVFDIYWKANLRNAELLKELKENPEQTTTESRLWVWFVFVQFVVIIIAVLLLISWLIAELIGAIL
ncbi:protein of unknown function (DUF4112) [Fodinibius salinus]|uniref:DUF4112 domain-containing protein n=1 Tax=Fodinibius salinus TaxID=860790 RepID=A0A5D3YFF6_9BACT|nr:DUF4112 domain-containing protein [Fodinibius salinus]TYP91743.1 protein of unknown function (DUF4112) [Fodinibius salinus]